MTNIRTSKTRALQGWKKSEGSEARGPNRRLSVAEETFADNWDRAFGKGKYAPKENEESQNGGTDGNELGS